MTTSENGKWADYYAGHNRHLSNIILHFGYLLSILWRRPKTLLEIGCGTADHSLFLKKMSPKIELGLLDNDRKILDKAKQECGSAVSGIYPVDLLDCSAVQSLPFFDVVMSQGVMEHFDDSQFVQIIENFRGKAGLFIFSVPSDNYPTLDFGNEILRSKKDMLRLLSRVPDIDFTVSGYFDIGLKTKLVGARKRKWLLKKLYYLFFGSNHLVVKIWHQKEAHK